MVLSLSIQEKEKVENLQKVLDELRECYYSLYRIDECFLTTPCMIPSEQEKMALRSAYLCHYEDNLFRIKESVDKFMEIINRPSETLEDLTAISSSLSKLIKVFSFDSSINTDHIVADIESKTSIVRKWVGAHWINETTEYETVSSPYRNILHGVECLTNRIQSLSYEFLVLCQRKERAVEEEINIFRSFY